MNVNICVLFFLLFFVAWFPVDTLGLKCYQCSDDNRDNCGDTFNSLGSGVRQVNSTSGYCWKMKAELAATKGVLRGGERLENLNSALHCPGTNKCQAWEAAGDKATICCCQDKDFCNTASTNTATLCVLLFNTVFSYIFVYLY